MKAYYNLFYCLVLVGCFCSCSKHDLVSSQPDEQVTVILDHILPSILHESSGLCFTDGNLWSFGDSGNPNQIFKIDTITGSILQTVTIQNFGNEDWEDITADSAYIYIGDFGNNDGKRKDLKILRIKKSDINPVMTQVTLNADAINFLYADQQNFKSNNNSNFDCEAVVSIQDSLYLFSKDDGDFQTRCYQLSKIPGSYSISPISTFDTKGKITSAAFNPVTKELALGGYASEKKFPFIWFFKNYGTHNFFEGEKIQLPLTTNPDPWQTEGLDYETTNRMFLSCESTPNISASLYTVQLNLKY